MGHHYHYPSAIKMIVAVIGLLFSLLDSNVALAQSSTPQAAQPQSVNVSTPCSAFSETMTDAEWSLLRNKMRDGYIVAHTNIIDSLKVEFVDSTEQIMPALSLGTASDANNTLIVPRRLLRNICTIIFFNMKVQSLDDAGRKSVIERLRRCRALPERATRCMLGIMANSNIADPSAAGAKANDQALGAIYALIARFSTLQTALYVLAHEAGHAVIRSTHTREQLAAIDEEFEADLLAQLAVIEGGLLPIGPLSVFSALASVEASNASRFSLHRPAMCRMREVEQVFTPMMKRLAAITAVRNSMGAKIDFAGSDDFSEKITDFKPLIPPWAAQICDSKIPVRAAVVMDDIARLESTARLIEDDLKNSSTLAERIKNLEMSTPEGKRLALGIYINISQMSGETIILLNQIMATLKSGVVDESIKNKILSLLNNTNSILQSAEIKTLRPQDVALIIQFDAIARYFTSPPGTPIKTASREFIRRYEKSLPYVTPGQVIADIKTAAKLFPEFDDASSLTSPMFTAIGMALPWIIAKSVEGECQDFSTSSLISPAQCETMQAPAIKDLETRMGWVWDGQPLAAPAGQ